MNIDSLSPDEQATLRRLVKKYQDYGDRWWTAGQLRSESRDLHALESFGLARMFARAEGALWRLSDEYKWLIVGDHEKLFK